MVARCPHAGPALGTLLDRHLDRRRAPCFGTWGLSVPSSPWVCPGTVGIGSPTGGRPGFPRAAGQRVGPDFPGGSWREGRGAGTAQFPPGSAGSGWESRRPPASGGCFSKERPHVQRPFPSCSSSAAHGHGSVRRLALHRALVRLRTRRTSLRVCKEETRADGKQTGRFTPPLSSGDVCCARGAFVGLQQVNESLQVCCRRVSRAGGHPAGKERRSRGDRAPSGQRRCSLGLGTACGAQGVTRECWLRASAPVSREAGLVPAA